MPRDIVVIGASAGGVETLGQLVKALPANFPAVILVAVHFPTSSVSVLPAILNRVGALPAKHPQSGEKVLPGQIYIAPPGHHLMVLTDHIQLNTGPRENGHRPSVDVLFRSAAHTYGCRVIGIILSGTMDDGTAGLAVVKARGGVAIAQDPEEALYEGMPRNAIKHVAVDYILTVAQIADCLTALVNDDWIDVDKEAPMAANWPTEAELVAKDKAALEQGDRPNTPSPLTCPDCGGVLWELQQGSLIRYRCHVGHAYSADTLLAKQAEEVERALWSAVRVLEEKAALSRRMATQAQAGGRFKSQTQFLDRAQEAEQNANLIRQIVLQQNQAQSQEAPLYSPDAPPVNQQE